MADLGTWTPASPLNASNNTYVTHTEDTDLDLQSTGMTTLPADFSSMATLFAQVEYSLTGTGTPDDDYDLYWRIVNGGTILAAADAGGTYVTGPQNITSHTDANSSTIQFAYVNTGATKTQWENATWVTQQRYAKNKGPDVMAIRTDYVALTGTYNAVAPLTFTKMLGTTWSTGISKAIGVTKATVAKVLGAQPA